MAVIGGGPAGMMAAGTAAAKGANVVLIEKNNKPGRKLLLTGKGRCNITNAEYDPSAFIETLSKKAKFLYPALHLFGVRDTLEFFNKRGLETKVERGKRVFPVSDRAGDVLRVLLDFLKETGVKVLVNTPVIGLEKEGRSIVKAIIAGGEIGTGGHDTSPNQINQKFFGGAGGDFSKKPPARRRQEKNSLVAGKYILCSGGLSYPGTGSTGEALRWLERLGHSIITPVPALTLVKVAEKWVDELKDLTLKNVRISVYQNNKKQDERFGEAQFVQGGIGGPIVLDMSKNIGELLKKGAVRLSLDLKPALEYRKLDARIQRDFRDYSNKMFSNSLDKLLPQKLIPVMVNLSGIEPARKVNSITKEERKNLLHLFKELPLRVRGLFGFEKALVTAGGVSLKEIDPRTMRSKFIDNLYFAGEIIDLDAPTGGYNLQICWSTAFAAGSAFDSRF